jgi:flagellar protein FliS
MVGNESLAYRYREVAVKTANPLQLVVMLYDAAIFSLQQAQKHIRNKDIEGRSQSLNRSISIISELQSCLNLKEGGEIASSLDRLYDYMKRSIFKANIDQSLQPVQEIEGLLENLRSAWKELVEKSPCAEETVVSAQPSESKLMPAGKPGPAPMSSLNISI